MQSQAMLQEFIKSQVKPRVPNLPPHPQLRTPHGESDCFLNYDQAGKFFNQKRTDENITYKS